MTDFPKILIFLKRRPGLSLEEFRDYYENHHMPLCLKYARGMTRYFRRYVVHPVDATGAVQELDFDVVTELWFAEESVRDAALAFAGRGILPQDVIADEDKLFDRPMSRMVAIAECETDLT
jgi:EthD domain